VIGAVPCTASCAKAGADRPRGTRTKDKARAKRVGPATDAEIFLMVCIENSFLRPRLIRAMGRVQGSGSLRFQTPGIDEADPASLRIQVNADNLGVPLTPVGWCSINRQIDNVLSTEFRLSLPNLNALRYPVEPVEPTEIRACRVESSWCMT
jgi:hypothetical protein